MDEAKRALVQEWLTVARLDLDSARALGSLSRPIYETAAFHCQQAAEKAIKGFLVFHDRRFTKTHELLALVKIAESIEPRFSSWRDSADNLTPSMAEFRYPDHFRKILAQEFTRALQSATDFYNFVLSVLPKEVRPTR